MTKAQKKKQNSYISPLSLEGRGDKIKRVTPLLDQVTYPADMRGFDDEQLKQLADELRAETIAAVATTGGHLGAGLGVVEITTAIHAVFNTPDDKLIFDVGHQCYPHKILTGRRDRIRTIRQGEASAKPVMALWGPSQTGKSTLMSGYLDDPEDNLGERSALRWSEGEPVRYVVGQDKSDSVIVLNPFNFGSDASGCVSRYVVGDEVPDPEHPVEITLANESQILHALAVGYLSECEERNDKGEITAWDADSFKALLDRQAGDANATVNREAFESLQQLAETVDLLRDVASGGSAAQGAAPASVRRANRLLATYVREILGREPPSMGVLFELGSGPGPE